MLETTDFGYAVGQVRCDECETEFAAAEHMEYVWLAYGWKRVQIRCPSCSAAFPGFEVSRRGEKLQEQISKLRGKRGKEDRIQQLVDRLRKEVRSPTFEIPTVEPIRLIPPKEDTE